MKLWNKLKEWWNRPSYWEQVKEEVENRVPCIKISCTFALDDGTTIIKYLDGQECEEYARYLHYVLYGSYYHRRLIGNTEWNWKRETKTVD